MMTAAVAERVNESAPMQSAAEAAELGTHFAQVMQALIEIVEQETRLVRAGRTREAAALEPQKSELARLYLADASRVRECRNHLRRHAPEFLEDLRDRHDVFRALLQINLTVLATAHAVAEGLVRGVSDELARKSSPQTYTAQGRNAGISGVVPPIAVSRRL
jgi:hypothetical protein